LNGCEIEALYHIFRKDKVLRFILPKDSKSMGWCVWSVVEGERYGGYGVRVGRGVVMGAVVRY
jgi:hypothetical protein